MVIIQFLQRRSNYNYVVLLQHVPVDFSRKYLRKRSVKLEDPSGRQWPVTCISNQASNSLSRDISLSKRKIWKKGMYVCLSWSRGRMLCSRSSFLDSEENFSLNQNSAFLVQFHFWLPFEIPNLPWSLNFVYVYYDLNLKPMC